MKRLSIIEIVSSTVWGGREKHILDLSCGLQQEGHSITVISKGNQLIDSQFSKLRLIKLPLRNTLDIVTIGNLASMIKKNQIDIVHVHNGKDAWLAVFATIIAGRGKVVITRHSVQGIKQSCIYHWFYQHVAKVICVSKITKEVFLHNNAYVKPGQVEVIYNGIDTEAFSRDIQSRFSQELGISKHEILISVIGRIEEAKGQRMFLKAAKLLILKNKNIKVAIVGTGKPEYMDLIRREIDNLALTNNVILCGFSRNVPAIIKSSDIVVLPSIAPEALGLIVLETMASGKLIIATNNGGQAEIIRHGETGLLVPPNDPEAMAAEISKAVFDINWAQRIATAGQKEAKTRFTVKRMTEETLRCFFSIVSQV